MNFEELIWLDLIARDTATAPEERVAALAILDAMDDMTEDEILEAAMAAADQHRPTPEQRARFEARLDAEIARIRDGNVTN